jgi:hypothetical protein
MSDIVLLLGPIVFNDFEVPGGIVFGGAQRLAIHRLPGGVRVIDALGRDDRTLSFSGTFSGPDATLRARVLDELRSAGLPLPLTWDVFFYTVIIDSFQADYRAGNWIPYKVSCTVIRDEASALVQTVVSLATATLADVGSALAPASAAGIDLTGTQSTLAAAGATTRGSADYGTAGAALGGAQIAIGASLVSAEAALASAGLVGASSADAGVTGLNAAVLSAGQIGQLIQASGYIGRAAVNLVNAST